MTLREVTMHEQLADYYDRNGLTNSTAKVAMLRKEMGIEAIRGERDNSPDDILPILEDAALVGYWRAFV